jgi:hypothetical protein
LRPFRAVKDFFVTGFVAETTPLAGDLFNQLLAAALYAHGELRSRNLLPVGHRHFL